MSRILTGNEDMHVELRVRTFIELCKEEYFNDSYLKSLTNLDNCKAMLLDSSFDTSSSVKGISKEKRQKLGYERGLMNTIKPGNYSNIWHLFALSNVTGCIIQSVYPDVKGSLIDRNYINITIRPEKVKQPDIVYIMWSHTQNSCLIGWSPNHFVPLMPSTMPAQSASPVLPQSVSTPPQPSSTNVKPFHKPVTLSSPTSPQKLPTSKSKFQGSYQYKSHFSNTWTKQWPFIIESINTSTCFTCSICQRTLSCAKQGIKDVKQHIATNLHQKNVKQAKSQKTIFQTCAANENSQNKVICM